MNTDVLTILWPLIFLAGHVTNYKCLTMPKPTILEGPVNDLSIKCNSLNAYVLPVVSDLHSLVWQRIHCKITVKICNKSITTTLCRLTTQQYFMNCMSLFVYYANSK